MCVGSARRMFVLLPARETGSPQPSRKLLLCQHVCVCIGLRAASRRPACVGRRSSAALALSRSA